MSDPVLAEILRTVQENNKSIASMRYDIATMRESIERMETRLDAMEADAAEATGNLVKHVEKEEAMWATFAQGWPTNPKTNVRDPRYHADWHERDIEKTEDRRASWKQIRTALLTAGALALGGFVWLLLVNGAKIELTRAVTPPAAEVKK